jgi:hypothetical protein
LAPLADLPPGEAARAEPELGAVRRRARRLRRARRRQGEEDAEWSGC